jgi:uncharacterized protein YccT (UPF0319 family)
MYQESFKRFLILATLPVSLFITINAFAVQLSVPDVYQLIKVNDQAVSNNFFSSETLVDLKVGRNILILQYSELFDDDDNDDHATIKSAPQIVLFTITNKGIKKYSIISPQINDEEQARIYAQSPKLKIVFADEVSGKKSEIKLLSKSFTEFEAELAFQKLEQLDIKPLIETKDNIIGNTTDINALEKLKLWWAQADEQQKKQFIDYTQQ